jgi:hypothetical protein
MSKQATDSEIIKLSLNLLSSEDQESIRRDATVLLGAIHEWNWKQMPGRKIMFGEAMAYETLYKLGRWLNEEYPLDGSD